MNSAKSATQQTSDDMDKIEVVNMFDSKAMAREVTASCSQQEEEELHTTNTLTVIQEEQE